MNSSKTFLSFRLNMNDPRSFVLGWACFGVAGTVGAYLGWRVNNVNQMQRRIEDVEVTRKRDVMLKELNEQVHKEGFKQAFKNLRLEENSKKSTHSKAHGTVSTSQEIYKDEDSESR